MSTFSGNMWTILRKSSCLLLDKKCKRDQDRTNDSMFRTRRRQPSWSRASINWRRNGSSSGRLILQISRLSISPITKDSNNKCSLLLPDKASKNSHLVDCRTNRTCLRIRGLAAERHRSGSQSSTGRKEKTQRTRTSSVPCPKCKLSKKVARPVRSIISYNQIGDHFRRMALP